MQRAENVSVADGCLRLALKKERQGEFEYTAGGVISHKTFRYGYYEARFRCPPGAGWHTSFWMMRHDWRKTADEPAAVQEIDVCEQDSVNRTSYLVNLHRWTSAFSRRPVRRKRANPDPGSRVNDPLGRGQTIAEKSQRSM